MGKKIKFYADIMAFNSKVTGSRTLCSIRFPNDEHVKFLVDCGMFHEKENAWLNGKLEFNPESIDFALITHSHVDHIGSLPLLVKRGYRGPIYTSSDVANFLMRPALMDCQSVLADTARIKSMPPIYSDKDVNNTMRLVQGVPMLEEWSPVENVKVTFFQNAHVPGAVIILVRAIYRGYGAINLLFTGDYNDKNTFFKARKLPTRVTSLPITIIEEATYGTTDSSECQPLFEEKLATAINQKKDVLLLAYSFGRTQEILYKLKCMQNKGLIPEDIPIYLDGKLGMKYTKIYPKLDISERMKDFLPENINFVSKHERESIIESKGQKIIVTSSGTGSYGPAQTYLPHFLAKRNAYLAFTGYTPKNTLGDKLKEMPYGSTIKVGGIVVKIFAKIDYFNEFSAHAKADTLLNLLKQFKSVNMVLINHGEEDTKVAYAERVKEEVKPKMVGILDRDYWFRIDQYGFVRNGSTKFV
ncbi:MAG: MBL fold metallo-hydrolase [Clostridia bacterium]|nr:MBL fold metallo-hydrolase [Clostridia bacterium]